MNISTKRQGLAKRRELPMYLLQPYSHDRIRPRSAHPQVPQEQHKNLDVQNTVIPSLASKEFDNIFISIVQSREANAMQKLAQSHANEAAEKGGISDEEDKRSSLGGRRPASVQIIKTTTHAETVTSQSRKAFISDTVFGYELCVKFRPRLAFDHVCGCPQARKSVRSKRIKKNQ